MSSSTNMTHNRFPRIIQFRQVIKDLKFSLEKHSISQTVFHLRGTTKLHGTHCDIVATRINDNDNEKWDIGFQSRNCIITLQRDNFGSCRFLTDIPSDEIQSLVNSVCTISKINKEEIQHIIIAGEFCGGNVQNNVALTQLPKMFVIFGIQINDKWVDFKPYYGVDAKQFGIYNISQGGEFRVELNLNDSESCVETLVKITDQVERECPFAKSLGVSGIGEGVVYIIEEFPSHHHLWFKVKGDEHAVSHVKTLKQTPTEISSQIKSVEELIPKIVTPARLQQGLEYLREHNMEVSKNNMGHFLKWIVNDVMSEELDVINQLQLDASLIKKQTNVYARTWYQVQQQ